MFIPFTLVLCCQGVLLPNLGNFTVGPVIGEISKKRIRPVFALLEGRYGTVSQERTRYAIGEAATSCYRRIGSRVLVVDVVQRRIADPRTNRVAHAQSNKAIIM